MTVVQEMNKNAFTTENIQMEWEIVESKHMIGTNLSFDRLPDKTKDVIRSLMEVGVIGSSQLMTIFLKKNKKNRSTLVGMEIILEHKMIRGKQIIPVYTLGRNGLLLQKQLGGTLPLNYWLNYKPVDVMNCIVTYQLLGRYRENMDTDLKNEIVYTPFITEFALKSPKGTVDYAIGVIRGEKDVSKFEHFFRLGQDIPRRIIFITTDLRLLDGLNAILKPFAKNFRVVIDSDLRLVDNFKEMFYQYSVEDNAWIKYQIAN